MITNGSSRRLQTAVVKAVAKYGVFVALVVVAIIIVTAPCWVYHRIPVQILHILKKRFSLQRFRKLLQ